MLPLRLSRRPVPVGTWWIRRAIWLLPLVACRSGVDESTEDTPTPYIYEEAEQPAPTWSAAEVGQALEGALGDVFFYTAHPVIDAYQQAASSQDQSCPSYYTQDNNQYWYDECSTSDGTEYAGYAFYIVYDKLEQDGAVYNGHNLFMVGEITTPDGDVFAGGGSAYALQQDGEGFTYWASQLTGSFTWTGTSAEGTWLRGTVEPVLTLAAYIAPAYEARYLVLDGGLNGLEGSASTVVFHELVVLDADYASCPQEPQGSASVRDANGEWYDVLFDGDTEGEVAAEDCDGCGAVWYRGEYVGEACIDVSMLTSWEESPW